MSAGLFAQDNDFDRCPTLEGCTGTAQSRANNALCQRLSSPECSKMMKFDADVPGNQGLERRFEILVRN
jgi:hypothetical protein